MGEDMSVAIGRMEEQIKELGRRMDNLEKLTETVNSLAISMERLTASMKATETNVDDLSKDVISLKEKPAKRWDKLIEVLIAAVVGGVIGHFIK